MNSSSAPGDQPTISRISPLQANQALLDHNGDFSAAAASLSTTTEYFRKLVSAEPALRMRWLEAPKAPPVSAILNRPDDVAVAEAIQREENALKKGVDGLGLSNRGKDLAVSCQRFYRNNFREVIKITGGGITKAFLEALVEIEKINEKLERIGDLPEEKQVAMEGILREDRSRLLEFIYKASAKVDQGVLIQAKIQKMFSEGGRGGRGDGKPGFTPLKKAQVVEP
jgi:hypothetical protein